MLLNPARAVWALVTVAVGLVLAVSALVALSHDRHTPAAFGSVLPPVAEPASVRSTATTPVPQAVGHAPTAMPEQTSARPTRLQIPSLGVSAPVDDVVTRSGTLGVPANITHVGWWVGSLPPGSAAGTTVIDGHVDSAANGKGALFHLADLRAGAYVTLSTHAGSGLTYRVYARRVYSKTHALPFALFATTGTPRLVLITCGGPFDAARRSYVDNIVIFAAPVVVR